MANHLPKPLSAPDPAEFVERPTPTLIVWWLVVIWSVPFLVIAPFWLTGYLGIRF